MTARFITLEGGEGVGKSTQLHRMADALRDRAIDVLVTREPGGSAGAEAIRTLLLGGAADRWSSRAEALLFAAARADHVERTIRPALAAGRWVLCDRFVDSSRAYQGVDSGLSDDDVMTLHKVGSAGLLPDRTLVLSLAAGEALARAEDRDRAGSDRIGGRVASYHDLVAGAFRRIAADDPARVHLVNGNGPVEAVTIRLIDAVADLIG